MKAIDTLSLLCDATSMTGYLLDSLIEKHQVESCSDQPELSNDEKLSLLNGMKIMRKLYNRLPTDYIKEQDNELVEDAMNNWYVTQFKGDSENQVHLKAIRGAYHNLHMTFFRWKREVQAVLDQWS